MAKLTGEEIIKALRDLEWRLINAIDETPRGITDTEIRQAFEKALKQTHN